MTQNTKPPEPDSQIVSALDEHLNTTKSGIFGRFRGYFLAGILVTAPIAITVYLTYSFFVFVDSRVRKLLPLENIVPPEHQYYALPGLGILAAVLFFVLVGWFAKNFLGRLIIRISEYVVDRLPVINTLYGAIKQIFETVMASKSDAFKDVVMFEYPRKEMWVMGFVTGTTKGEVQSLTDTEVVNVFLPTTPNPTSGFLLFVPKKDLTYMKMGVEEAIKMIVSGGIVTPPEKSTEKKA